MREFAVKNMWLSSRQVKEHIKIQCNFLLLYIVVNNFSTNIIFFNIVYWKRFKCNYDSSISRTATATTGRAEFFHFVKIVFQCII